MRRLNKLLSYLPATFNASPKNATALRFVYDDWFAYTVEGTTLTVLIAGPTLVVDLSQHTIASLAIYLNSQSGFRVTYVDRNVDELSATTLKDTLTGSLGVHQQLARDLKSIISTLELLGGKTSDNPAYPYLLTSEKNLKGITGIIREPVALYNQTSVIYGLMKAFSESLTTASDDVLDALDQMTILTADDKWLDLWGEYFSVPRDEDETDDAYGPRLIAEVIRPRINNIAIATAVQAAFGQPTTVTDVTLTEAYGGGTRPRYGLFDVVFGYDLESGLDLAQYSEAVVRFLDRFRAAGTHMRYVTLAGSDLNDAATVAADEGASQYMLAAVDAFEDAFGPSSDFLYDSTYNHDGTKNYCNGTFPWDDTEVEVVVSQTDDLVSTAPSEDFVLSIRPVLSDVVTEVTDGEWSLIALRSCKYDSTFTYGEGILHKPEKVVFVES